MTKVKLADLMEALDFQFDEQETLINITTGEIFFLRNEVLSIVENEETDYPEWMDLEIEQTKEYLKDPDNFIPAPDKDEVGEYGIMEQFAVSQENQGQKEKLLIALQGKGAFRRFKGTINFLGIEKQWYAFRDEKFKNFALEWCEFNDIEVVE